MSALVVENRRVALEKGHIAAPPRRAGRAAEGDENGVRLLVVVVVAKGGKITPEGAMKAAPAPRRAIPAEVERSKSVIIIVVTHHRGDRESILGRVTVRRMWVGGACEYPSIFSLSLPLDRLSERHFR